MSPSLPRSVVAAEDAHFCKHHGIDWGALREAIDDAKEDGTPFRGASTITQQVAKNLFLWQGRDFVRKALEFPLALWIDFVLPKPRILEIYLNIAELGPQGQFGVEAAQRLCLRQVGGQPLAPGGGPFGLDPAQSGQTQRPDPRAGRPAAGRDLCGEGAGRLAFDLLAGKSLISGPFSDVFSGPKALDLRPAFLYKPGLDRHSARLGLRVLSRPLADDAPITPIPRGY